MGHHFEYDYSLMLAAEKLGCHFVALGHVQAGDSVTSRMPVEKRFRLTVWDRFKPAPWVPKVGRKLDLLLTNYYFYRVLRSRFGDGRGLSSWVIFGHMITMRQLLGWAWWIRGLPRKNPPRVALLFRYDSDWFVSHPRFGQAARILQEARLGDRLQLYADTDRLARDYGRLLPLPVGVLPIPHTAHLLSEHADAPPGREVPLCLVSAGNAREEKGFLDILQAIRVLEQSGQLDRFSFVLQANETSEAIRREMAALTEKGLASVTFIEETLSTEAYYRLLGRADVVLLPYHRDVYRSRSSGILAEALAAGKPVIVTEDTWLSDQMRQFGGGVTCRSRDPADLARAILELSRSYEEHRERADLGRKEWGRLHNPEALVRALVNPPSAVRPRPRVGFLYPSLDPRSGQNGATKRAALLIEFLKEHAHEVRVVWPGPEAASRDGNVTYLPHRSGAIESSLVRKFRRWIRRYLNRVKGESLDGSECLLLSHYETVLQRSLFQKVRRVVRWADVVFLEYTFWASRVIPACRRANTKVILTDYDAVFQQVNHLSRLCERTRRVETEMLKLADCAVCVSEADREIFRQDGVDAVVIPHGIDWVESQGSLPADDPFAGRAGNDQLALPPGRICLFVGSLAKQNLEAASFIRRLARSVRTSDGGEPVLFVTAGLCHPVFREENFVALGTVSEAALRTLYGRADLVLIPLTGGTGASVKAVEAMARGKAILGTSVGFRGYPVQTGIQCVICDDLAQYPCLIAEMLASAERLTELGRQARAFARSYDYRIAYRPYLGLMESALGLSPGALNGDSSSKV